MNRATPQITGCVHVSALYSRGHDRAIRRWLWVPIAMLFASLCATDVHAILRRHDVPDSEYLVEADAYAQVVDLIEPGDCLATLIDRRWLITAGHCAEDFSLPGIVRIAGVDRAVEEIVYHPDYDGWTQDIALVRLKEPVTDVEPLPLYRQMDELDKTVILLGRGDTGTGIGGQSEATLDLLTRRATNTVTVADNTLLKWTFNSPDSAVVTALEGISGDGDSGGPAFIEVDHVLHVAGISSWQDAPDDQLGKYGVVEVYSRVSTELEFIDGRLSAGLQGDDGASDDQPPESSAPPENAESTGLQKSPDEGCSVGGAGSGWPLVVLMLWLISRRTGIAKKSVRRDG